MPKNSIPIRPAGPSACAYFLGERPYDANTISSNGGGATTHILTELSFDSRARIAAWFAARQRTD
jgi:hypothetical protein